MGGKKKGGKKGSKKSAKAGDVTSDKDAVEVLRVMKAALESKFGSRRE